MLLVLFTGQAAAQGTPQRTLAARAFDLERSGNYAGAVTAYRALLADDPAMVPALLGLERALSALSRLPEMTKEIQAALSTPGVPSTAYAVAIRVWTGAGMPDSARRVVERWAAEDPGNEAPWQEWGYAASARREFGLARTALTAGRARLGRPDALAAELAQLASLQEDYRTAVPEWVQAVEARTEQRGAAEALLGQAPAMLRPQVLALLTASGSPVGLRLAAVLKN
jgi:tetratricopeptide (TPR) repeat protein